jgi:hypothetical protein
MAARPDHNHEDCCPCNPACPRFRSAVRTPCPTVPHADLIRAVLDGKVVQKHVAGEWATYDNPITALKQLVQAADFGSGVEFRVKPDPVTKEQALKAYDVLLNTGGINMALAREQLRRFIEEKT